MFTSKAHITAFHELMTAHSTMPFEWGVHDCATVAKNVALIKRDLQLPNWNTMIGALRQRNGLTLAQNVCLHLRGKVTTYIGIGDIFVACNKGSDDWHGQIIGVFDGSCALVVDVVGFKELPRAEIIDWWSI